MKYTGIHLVALSVVLVAPAVMMADSAANAAQKGPQALAPEHAMAMLNVNFQRLDCENSGVAHIDEIDDHFAQIWLPADRDQNRSLSPSEFRGTHTTVDAVAEVALFADADANGDGRISASEMRWHLRRLMRLVDANGDAVVTLAEAGLPPDPYALDTILERKRRAAEARASASVPVEEPVPGEPG